MTILHTFTQTPEENLDYFLDYQRELDPLDDEIISSAWSLPDVLTATNADFDGMKAWVFIAGGVEGQIYPISNLVRTQAGRTYAKFFRLKIETPTA
jgi:hypothetical protein